MSSFKVQPHHDPRKNHHERPLKWFASPISHEEHVPVSHALAGKSDQTPLPLQSPTEYQSISASEPQTWHHTVPHPVFKRNSESTPSELFYDLFFVANLTAFTEAHDINDGPNLRSYIGFFCLLWFTWFNVSLFDLRLARDSVFDRVAKAVQFGVMTGFIGVGAEFTPNKGGVFESGFIFSVLLLVSRWTLCVQYIVAFCYVKHYKGAFPPMLMTIAITFLSGVAYLAVGFAFPPFPEDSPKAYIAWYFIAVIESALTLLASMRWRMLSFKGTHVVERMSLLTLIILGEGVIAMADAIHLVLEHDLAGHQGTTTASFRGAVVSAITLLYFLYMLYFDNLPDEHFGTIRSQIWACFHFPLHVCLILFVEGSSQGLKWRRILSQLDIMDQEFEKSNLFEGMFFDAVSSADYTLNQTVVDDYLNVHNTTEGGEKFFEDESTNLALLVQDMAEKIGLADIESFNEVVESLSFISSGFFQSQITILASLVTIYMRCAQATLEAFGARLPETEPQGHITIQIPKLNMSDGSFGDEAARRSLVMRRDEASGAPVNETQQAVDSFKASYEEFKGLPDLFNLTFQYFYVSGGLALVALGILSMLGKKAKWNKRDYVRFGSFFAFGAVLSLLALTTLNAATFSFATSPMVVPLASILVCVPVLVQHL